MNSQQLKVVQEDIVSVVNFFFRICSTNYSEQEFKRDFQDEPDEDEEYDLDPRSVPDYNLVESEEMSLEETADTICSLEVFGGRKNKSYIWRLDLRDEDPKTIDIDLRQVID